MEIARFFYLMYLNRTLEFWFNPFRIEIEWLPSTNLTVTLKFTNHAAVVVLVVSVCVCVHLFGANLVSRNQTLPQHHFCCSAVHLFGWFFCFFDGSILLDC